MKKNHKNNEKNFIRTIKIKMISQNANFWPIRQGKLNNLKFYDVRKNEKRKNKSRKGKKKNYYEMNEGMKLGMVNVCL